MNHMDQSSLKTETDIEIFCSTLKSYRTIAKNLINEQKSETNDDIKIIEIIDGIFIGKNEISMNIDILNTFKIKTIFSLISKNDKKKGYDINVSEKFFRRNCINFYHKELIQKKNSIIKFVDTWSDLINENLKKGNILIHCNEGNKRCPPIIIYYLCKYYNKSLEDSFEFVQNKIGCLKCSEKRIYEVMLQLELNNID